MLHVNPAAVKAAAPAFNPHAYIAYTRACGVQVEIDDRGSSGIHLVWDISQQHEAPADVEKVPYDAENRREADRQIYEILRAEQWIAGARECGLVVFPWRSETDRGGVMQFGQDDDGPNDFSAATSRFSKHPACKVMEGCRKGVVFETLCTDFGVDPDDPHLFRKVNAQLAEQAVRRAADRPPFQQAAE